MQKNILLSSSRAFSLSTSALLLSTPVENSEATRKKSYKMQRMKHKAVIPITNIFEVRRSIFQSYYDTIVRRCNIKKIKVLGIRKEASLFVFTRFFFLIFSLSFFFSAPNIKRVQPTIIATIFVKTSRIFTRYSTCDSLI